ncbi:MAG: M20/M25/M40 family metallo-hydrolase [Gemmatimonadetes bacterium]|nr:M20/M25/M40 family metallo-hydrolase [Gemmatimonadota bacterium]
MRLPIDPEYVLRTARRLVQIESVNPAFCEGRSNEVAVAGVVAGALERLALEVTRREPEPGRITVLGRLPGRGGPTLLLYAHLDTVGVEGMAAPFGGALRDGRIYGRGAYDMKGSLAACLGAVKALVDARVEPPGDVLVAAVADEEAASIGMTDLLAAIRPDAAIVTEPTELRLCLAHKGFAWLEVETLGRAAHGSRFEEGVDANMRMGRFLVELEALERRLRASPPHPLLGPPSLHAAVLRGGTGPSTYAASCRLELERRTVPGESEARVVQELREITERLAAADPSFRAEIRPLLYREPFEARADSRVASTVARLAREVLGAEPARIGLPFWMDAALLAAAGVDTVVIGPSGAGAHAPEEWVEVDSIVRLAEILAGAAVAYGS